MRHPRGTSGSTRNPRLERFLLRASRLASYGEAPLKRIDRLIITELIPPWLFGVGMFTALVMAATYLNRLAGYLVDGAPPLLVLQLVGLLFPAILVKTFSMAVLLAALLAFGRLSSDSELVALRAGGASLIRIVLPVAVFSIAISFVSFAFGEKVVPFAARRSIEIAKDLAVTKGGKSARPLAKSIVSKKKLRAFVNAENVNLARSQLEGVTVVAYDEKGQKSFYLSAGVVRFEGSLPDLDLESMRQVPRWRIVGGARLMSADGSTVTTIQDEVWPTQIPTFPQTLSDLTAERDDEFDAMSMAELGASIAKHEAAGDKTDATLANYRYGYWTKLSTPLAAVVFGVLGAVLGIRSHRTGTAAGFALAVGIIFGYVALLQFMNVWAMGGVIPAYVASFAPLAIGVVATGVIMWRRNA